MIGHNFKLVRIAAGISQDDLAQRAGLSGNTPVSNFERDCCDSIQINLLQCYLSLAASMNIPTSFFLQDFSAKALIEKFKNESPNG